MNLGSELHCSPHPLTPPSVVGLLQVEAAEGKDITVYSKFIGVTYLTSLASFLHVSGIALHVPRPCIPTASFDRLQYAASIDKLQCGEWPGNDQGYQ